MDQALCQAICLHELGWTQQSHEGYNPILQMQSPRWREGMGIHTAS